VYISTINTKLLFIRFLRNIFLFYFYIFSEIHFGKNQLLVHLIFLITRACRTCSLLVYVRDILVCRAFSATKFV
jgi:hypothetical protein